MKFIVAGKVCLNHVFAALSISKHNRVAGKHSVGSEFGEGGSAGVKSSQVSILLYTSFHKPVKMNVLRVVLPMLL